MTEQVGHESHRLVDAAEKRLVTRAQVVQPASPSGAAMKRFLGHSPLQAKRTSHSRQ